MTEVFTAETTIDRPIDGGVGAADRLGHCGAVDAGRGNAPIADGPTSTTGTTLVLTTRGKQAHRADRRPGPGTPYHAEVQPGRSDRTCYVNACAPARPGHRRQSGGHLPDHRSRAAARPDDQICHPQGRQRPTRRVRRHLRIRIGAAMSSTARANGSEQAGSAVGGQQIPPTDAVATHMGVGKSWIWRNQPRRDRVQT